jgi:hypothetical protein
VLWAAALWKFTLSVSSSSHPPERLFRMMVVMVMNSVQKLTNHNGDPVSLFGWSFNIPTLLKIARGECNGYRIVCSLICGIF